MAVTMVVRAGIGYWDRVVLVGSSFFDGVLTHVDQFDIRQVAFARRAAHNQQGIGFCGRHQLVGEPRPGQLSDNFPFRSVAHEFENRSVKSRPRYIGVLRPAQARPSVSAMIAALQHQINTIFLQGRTSSGPRRMLAGFPDEP